ncbi:DUF5339 domain-containing protein [Entomohabitans teleogrylli]|uniref:DUF5339 domain-containing protein n=1 Tax=Entomohabitans teleogrylli TaxID=1384589 RepID=UPI00073D26B2|nr:DUF5339 domain-containing protein [Entomohabitans teleogrylli]
MKKALLVASLVMFSGSSFAAVTETCQKYLDEVDAIMEQASANEAAKAQVDALKVQLAEAKKQIESMPEAEQNSGCQQGMAAMAQMKQAMGLQ